MFDPATLKQFDGVVFVSTTQLKFDNPAHRKALVDFVVSGKGVVGIHAASDNFPTWPEGQELMGASSMVTRGMRVISSPSNWMIPRIPSTAVSIIRVSA